MKNIFIVISIFSLLSCSKNIKEVLIQIDSSNQKMVFAKEEILSAIKVSNLDLGSLAAIKLSIDKKFLEDQSYNLIRIVDTIFVVGGDATGAMYGGIELSEMIKMRTDLSIVDPIRESAFIKERGLKFNIPLDIRTPSYQDAGDAAKNNILEMWNFDFWKQYIDMMARNRYNVLTLWNPHPFPSMIKLDDYPDIALDDVCGTSFPIDTDRTDEPVAKYIAGCGVSQEILDNLVVLKKMSMDEKIFYWRKVMKYAKDMGIEVYFITWNINLNSVAPPGWYREQKLKMGNKGKYGINNDQENVKTIKYLRESVKQFILTYPDLAGIGITAGENMEDRTDEFDRESWLWKTYGQGVLDAKKVDPTREVKFIHRYWMSGIGKIVNEFFNKYPDEINLSYKYARARMYALPDPQWANEYIEEYKPFGLKSWWNIRNDDIFNFRWGNPEYASAFIKNLPEEALTAGYYMGSDGYVWGREFISKHPQFPRELEIDKHWYNFMLWGRMGYNPDMNLDHVKGMLSYKYPGADVDKLFKAWATASLIPSQVTRFHWHNWDFQWAVEGCLDLRKGFHTIEDFINNPTMEGSNILTIPEYVKLVKSGKKVTQLNPLTSATKLDSLAEKVLLFVNAELQNEGAISNSYDELLYDLKSWANMGKYYSSKIKGALYTEMFRNNLGDEYKIKAIKELEEAVINWQEYAKAASRNYKPQFMAKTRTIDWTAITKDVKNEIKFAETFMESK